MQYGTIRDYYGRLTSDSVENIVSHLWYNILREYFLISEGFQLEVQPSPIPDRTKVGWSNDITILYVNHSKRKTLILVEHNRVSLETDPSSWTYAADELTNHMKLARLAVPADQPARTIFGIVTVGHYSRFYVMGPGQVALMDHPATGDDLLEFSKDESLIASLLLSIKDQASPAAL
jgi:hypothetical protein